MRFLNDELKQNEFFTEISENVRTRTDFFSEESEEEYSPEEYERKQEEKLISSLSEANNMNRCCDIDIKEYFSSIFEFLISDIRFSYRKLYLCSKNEIFKGFKDKYLVTNLLILSLINEIEYKNPIKLSARLENDTLKLKYELKVEENDANLDELKSSNKRIFSKIGYINSLIASELSSFDLKISAKTLTASLTISESKTQNQLSCHASLDSYACDILKEYLERIFY